MDPNPPASSKKRKRNALYISMFVVVLVLAGFLAFIHFYKSRSFKTASSSQEKYLINTEKLYNPDGSWKGPKVILIGVDGLDFDLADRLIAEGRLPNLAKLAKEGASGKVLTWHISFSPVIWTIIATGVLPNKNGINNFVVKDPKTGRLIPMDSTMRKSPAIWNMASQFGLKSVVVNYFCTWPAEKVNGVIVSDWANLNNPEEFAKVIGQKNSDQFTHSERLTYPEEVFKDVLQFRHAVSDVSAVELAEYLQAEPKSISAIEKDDRLSMGTHITWLRQALNSDAFALETGLYLYKKNNPDLFIVYVKGLDMVSHHFWMYHEPEKFPGVSREAVKIAGPVITRYYEHVDEMLGKLQAEIPPETYIIVMSDHGFGANKPGAYMSGDHNFIRHAALFARGPSVKRGAHLNFDDNTFASDCAVTDITPTILTWLGLPLAKNFDTRPCPPLIEGLTIPGAIDGYDYSPTQRPQESEDVRRAQEENLKQLKALGYIR